MYAALILLAALGQDASAPDREKLESAKEYASKAGNATVAGDYEKLIDLTHPSLIKAAGDRTTLMKVLKDGMKEMADQGFRLKSMKAEAPEKLHRTENGLFCMVPVTLVVEKMGEFRLTGANFLVGHSADDGKTWTFLDTVQGEKRVRKIFPEIPADLPFPARPEPKVEPLK